MTLRELPAVLFSYSWYTGKSTPKLFNNYRLNWILKAKSLTCPVSEVGEICIRSWLTLSRRLRVFSNLIAILLPHRFVVVTDCQWLGSGGTWYGGYWSYKGRFPDLLPMVQLSLSAIGTVGVVCRTLPVSECWAWIWMELASRVPSPLPMLTIDRSLCFIPIGAAPWGIVGEASLWLTTVTVGILQKLFPKRTRGMRQAEKVWR